MTKALLQRLVNSVFRPRFRKSENKLGYRLSLRNISDHFINGVVEWDMTNTFKKFGLNIKAGADYWTMGHIVNGTSSRFDRNAPEYQAWLGGYIVKFAAQQTWTVEDHFKLAIADQNSWLHTYGDPQPLTSILGWKFTAIGPIHAGQYSGTLYEGGCTTHSDVGNGPRPIKFRLEADVMADLFNLSNPKLRLTGEMLRPPVANHPYETVKLRGYIAIFEVEKNVKVVLYGNGAIVKTEEGDIDTFEMLKNDLRTSLQACEIVKCS